MKTMLSVLLLGLLLAGCTSESGPAGPDTSDTASSHKSGY
jgi:PBP1b-binding outer membrane lipoprotein LpoB